MIRVALFGSLRQFTDGVAELEVEAASVRQLLAALSRRFPALGPHLEKGIAVAVDGQILQDALFEPLPDGAEVHLLPQIAGG